MQRSEHNWLMNIYYFAVSPILGSQVPHEASSRKHIQANSEEGLNQRPEEGKMHQLWMWSDTAPLLAVGAFQGCHVSRHTDIWVKKAKKKLSKLYKKFVQGISGTSKTTSKTSSKTSSKTTQDNLGIRRQSRREGISKSAIHVPPTNVPHGPHLHLRVPWHGPMGMDGMDLLWIRY